MLKPGICFACLNGFFPVDVQGPDSIRIASLQPTWFGGVYNMAQETGMQHHRDSRRRSSRRSIQVLHGCWKYMCQAYRRTVLQNMSAFMFSCCRAALARWWTRKQSRRPRAQRCHRTSQPWQPTYLILGFCCLELPQMGGPL